jgi:hypothetical protein
MAQRLKYWLTLGGLGFLLGLGACIEIFDPVIDPQAEVLVVESLLTDQWGPHWVKLFMAVPYDEGIQSRPVSNAQVYVADQNGTQHLFYEREPGMYRSFAGLRAQEGYSYVLHIETEQGEFYQSTPQMLNPGPQVDSLESLFTNILVEQQNAQGETFFGNIPGLEFTAEIEAENGASPLLRFEAVVLVQYVLYELGSADPAYLYCRRKMPLDNNVNIVVPDFESSIGEVVRHKVAFMPQAFGVVHGDQDWGLLRLDRRIIILRQFALNQDAYIFYKGLREQLSSDGMLFDPIPGQLIGNIKCMSDPRKQALGLFEVSAAYTSTFALIREPINENHTQIWRIHDLDYLSEHDCSYEVVPHDWLF